MEQTTTEPRKENQRPRRTTSEWWHDVSGGWFGQDGFGSAGIFGGADGGGGGGGD